MTAIAMTTSSSQTLSPEEQKNVDPNFRKIIDELKDRMKETQEEPEAENELYQYLKDTVAEVDRTRC